MNSEIVSLVKASYQNALMLEIGLIAISTFLITNILRFFASKALTKIPDGFLRYTFYKEIITFIKKPLVMIIWVWSIATSLTLISEQYHIPVLNFMDSVRLILVSLIAGINFSALINNISKKMTKISMDPGNTYDKVTIEILTKIAKGFTFSITLVFLLRAVGVSVGAILAISGISGVALGFSIRDLLASFFGMIVLYSDKPFVVGDRIKLHNMPKGSNYGYVENIEWRITAMRTPAGKLVYIPNYMFCASTVENISRAKHSELMIHIDVEIVQISSIRTIIESLKSELIKINKIIESKGIYVEIHDLSKEVVGIDITCYSYDVEDMSVTNLKNDIFIRAVEIIRENHTELAKDHRLLEH
ncbi:Mechanosensitive ion channel protein [Candidatus Cyrtobacter comes]|uniref:Mechanosensitive ion channel protein n=1 Tax=Candidatus Cyrtobacter comes TaxID=675776 RepID=A0ABU5L6U8_9RICK|nr:mechanosensitive ion channel domain-containing protein [Candidatus Cyrtobacter comes]MDZ5761850.1 Mechanosensitive ion channel protein [Candidatus Cyrtobacter comes]